MRKPRQRSVVRPAARLPGHWTPSPTPSPDLEPTGLLVMRSGSKFFSEEEEELLVKLHALLGNRWSLIAGRLPGRTGKEVESHWNSKMRRELRRMGADDPGNHRSMTTLLAPTPADEQQRPRRRPLDLLREGECPAKHPSRRRCLSSNDDIAGDCVSDAGSYCRAQQELAYGLNLELTLSTPCLYSGEREQVTDH